MTQKKLEIIGPYTPEHEGPFCTRGGRVVRLITKTEGAPGVPIVGFIDNAKHPAIWFGDGRSYPSAGSSLECESDLMSAREVPVVREFWLNEFKRGDGCVVISYAHHTELQAINERHELENWNWARTIHVREVLPGEDA